MIVSEIIGAGSATLGALMMGPGGAMLATVAALFLGLILLERWQNGRKRRRDAARIAAGADSEEVEKARKEAEQRPGLWGVLFGPAAGREPPYDPMQDMHPDELEGNYDGDPSTQAGG